MPDYKNGKIYKIWNDVNDKVYVGSTTRGLSERMRSHMNKRKCKSHYLLYVGMDNIGVEHFKIELIEDFSCELKNELLRREGYWIRKLNTHKCGYNKILSGRKNAEWRMDNREIILQKKREYYERNKELILQKQKEYCVKNVDKIRERRKKYAFANRDKIRAYHKKYRVKNKDKKRKKDRQYALKNREKIREYQKEYRVKNKDKLKEYYQKNKDKINKRRRELRRIKREKQIE